MFYEVIPGRNIGKGLDVLTYAFDDSLPTGTLVEIPIGHTRAAGIVVKKVAQPNFACKKISRILYSKPLPKHLVATAKWMASYYATPISGIVATILPTGVLKKRRKTEQMFGETARTEVMDEKFCSGSRPAGPSPWAAGAQPRAAALRKTPSPEHFRPTTRFSSIPLNTAQKNALQGLQKAPGATKLLFGVTGSGKTNVYLSEAAKALIAQKSVILLVPEIALTGQLVQVFGEVFGNSVTVIHSKQTEAERHLIFERILTSEQPQIVVGPRSALFAPVANLGLIIVDEEHENTYYQDNTPKYSAIRVASSMAKEAGAQCILGSATPAVDDYYLAKRRDCLVVMSEKAKKTAIRPEIQVIDFKKREHFSKNRYFSNPLLAAIKDNLENGRQTLIFHNRRGSSPLTICESCGEELLCPNCFLPLTLHADSYELMCHTCGFKEKVPMACPKCGAPELIHKGFGTKLLETELEKLFPKAHVKRFDADTKRGESLDIIYEAVRDGQIDILVGTQTLAKGLDLPKLATVGVVQADAGLSLPDYAAEERTFQLLTQVIGRVGRGHIDKAQVFIQTFRPEHPVINLAIKENYVDFADYLLKKRRASGFPPYMFVAKCEITIKTEVTVLKKVRELVKVLSGDKRLYVSPPIPAFHERTNRGYTWQIIVRSRSRTALTEALSGIDHNFRVALDPPSLL
ncbi:primosomal protein N' [Candidatus Saccharibacteria bacterium]|nr:primosomal protein N' [Candidatus Saccharibacteria bacterium]